MVRRLLYLLLPLMGLMCLALPGIASADTGGLAGYKVKLTGWPGDQAGASVAIGDVNGDGISDYVVGDPSASPNGRPGSGSVYVIYGQAGDKATGRTVDLSQIPLAGQASSSLGYRIDGWSAGDHFGASVAVGDLNNAKNPANGDPIGDVVVGDPNGSPMGRQGAGEVYVIYGQTGENTPELDVSKMTATQGKLLAGWAAGDETGTSVAVGRFNQGSTSGSGCAASASAESIAIGAPGASPTGQSQEGEVYDFFGEGLGSGGTTTVQIDLRNLNPTNGTPQLGYLIDGNWAGDQLGQSVADGGKVNSDCDDAILIGDPNAGPDGMWQAGATYVVWGQPQLSYPGTENVSTLGQNNQGYRINGPVAGAHYGTSVANAGDIDGDGTPDVIAGAPGWDYGGGEAFVTYGYTKTNNPQEVKTLFLNQASGNPSEGYAIQGYTQDYTFNGTQGHETADSATNTCQYFHSWTEWGNSYPNAASVTAIGDRAGTTVAELGDVNGDGVPDVLVGTPGWNDSAGAVQVIYGHHGRTQGPLALYSSAGQGQGLSASQGETIADANTPAPQSAVFGGGNPFAGAGKLAGQVIEQTEEYMNDNEEVGDGFCSNYMREPGDQAASAVAATGGLTVVGAPTYGTTPNVVFKGAPGNPTVWFADGGDVFQVGVGAGGEADWNLNQGSGAVYVLGL
jgi:FG-GAP repeat